MLDYAAFPEQRQALIRQILQESGRVVCTELATQMKVSEHTIRRDLHELSKEGFCKKVYGGAVLQLPDAGTFSRREQENSAQKATIAQKAATLIKAGGCIFMDTGTTNLALAKALPAELSVTVVTNSPGHRDRAAATSAVRGDHHRAGRSSGRPARRWVPRLQASLRGLSLIRPLSVAVRWILRWG